jgi:FMN reductase
MNPTDERPRQIVVVSAGLSQPSSTRLLADRLAAATVTATGQRGGRAEVRTVELREWAHDLTNTLLTGFPSEGLREVLTAVLTADAVIAVSPIFSASYSGLFKTFVDVLDVDALQGTPVLIGATGGSARHSLAVEHAMRPLFSYLRAVVVPTAVYAAPEDWASGLGSVGSSGELAARIDRAAGGRARLGPPDPPAGVERRVLAPSEEEGEVIPFTRLLAAQRSAAVQQQR